MPAEGDSPSGTDAPAPGVERPRSVEPGPASRRHAVFSSAPPLWHIGAVVLICSMVVYAYSLPFGMNTLYVAHFPLSLLSLCFIWPGGVAIIAIDYLLRLAVCASHRTSSWRTWRWYVTPICMAVAVHAWQTHWPLHVRWVRSQTEFEREGPALLAGPPTTPAEWAVSDFVIPWLVDYKRRVGSYFVRSISVHPDEGLVFFATGAFFRGDWGVLYDPQAREDWYVGEELSPGWYTYMYSRP